MGKPLPSIVMTLTHMVGCYIPLAYLGSQIAGPTGVFAAAAISNLVAGMGAYRWIRKTCRQPLKPASSPL